MIKLENKVISCLDGKERVFSSYGESSISYRMYKDGKATGRAYIIKAEDIAKGKYPKFVTEEMLFETISETDTEATELDTTELDTTELDTTELDTTELDTTELEPINKIVGYMRISTDNDSQKFDRQEAQLLEAGCTYIYKDRMSGAKRERPELNRMLEELHKGDVIVITELARLSRSTLDLLELVKLLKAKSILLKSLHDTWLDISEDNPMSNFMLTMMSGLAEMERAMITERVRQGVAVAKRKGVRFGRPKANKDKVAYALELYDAGEHTTKQICNITGISKATLFRKIKEREQREKEEASEIEASELEIL